MAGHGHQQRGCTAVVESNRYATTTAAAAIVNILFAVERVFGTLLPMSLCEELYTINHKVIRV